MQDPTATIRNHAGLRKFRGKACQEDREAKFRSMGWSLEEAHPQMPSYSMPTTVAPIINSTTGLSPPESSSSSAYSSSRISPQTPPDLAATDFSSAFVFEMDSTMSYDTNMRADPSFDTSALDKVRLDVSMQIPQLISFSVSR